FSGPTPASESAATTFTLAGKARQASVAVPSKIRVSRVIASRSIFCDSIHGAPARPRGGLRVSIVTESIAPTRAPLTPSSPPLDPAARGRGRRGRQHAAPARGGDSAPHPPAEAPAKREHDQVLAGPERPWRDLVAQVRLGGCLDHQFGSADELVQGEKRRRRA